MEVACVLLEFDLPAPVARIIGVLGQSSVLGMPQAAVALVTLMRDGHGTPGPWQNAMAEAVYVFGVTVCARMRPYERELEMARFELALQAMNPQVLDYALRARRHAALLDTRHDQQNDVKTLALFERDGECHPRFALTALHAATKPPVWSAPPVPR